MSSGTGRSKPEQHPDWMWTHWRKGRRFKCSGPGAHGEGHFSATEAETPSNHLHLPSENSPSPDSGPIIHDNGKSENDLSMPTAQMPKKRRSRPSNWMWTYRRKRRPKRGSGKKSSLFGQNDVQIISENGIIKNFSEPKSREGEEDARRSEDPDTSNLEQENACGETEEGTVAEEMQILFKCPFCLLVYPGADELIKHLTTHDSDYLPSQDRLSEGSSADNNDDNVDVEGNHDPTRKTSGTDTFSCTICRKMLSSKWNLIIHSRIHKGNRPFPCNHCGKRFGRNDHLQKHMRFSSVHRGGKKATDVNVLSSKHDHGTADSQKYGKRLTQKRNLVAHATGDRPFPCPSCSQSFRRKANLQRHMRAFKHGGEIRESASKSINNAKVCNDEVKRKTKIDKKGPPFSCHTCGERFHQKTQLQQHARVGVQKNTAHGSREVTNIDKVLPVNGLSGRRERGAGGKGPYPCSHCGKRFAIKSNLLVHDRIHTGYRPFPCPSCGGRFRQKAHLQKHIRRVHGIVEGQVRSPGKKSSRLTLPPPCNVIVTRCDHLLPFYLSAKLSKSS